MFIPLLKSALSSSRSPAGLLLICAVFGLTAIPPLNQSARAQQPAAADSPLEALSDIGRSVKRKLSGGQTHAYQILLAGDEFIRLRAKQNGIDLVLALLDEAGNKLIESDRPNGDAGSEGLVWLSQRAGRFRLEVKTLDPKAGQGEYEISLTEKRQAVEADLVRMSAQSLLSSGNALLEQNALREAGLKFEQAAKQLQELGDKEEMAYAQLSLGMVYHSLGERTKAARLYEAAGAYLATSDSQAWRQVSQQIFGRLSDFYSALGTQPSAADKAYIEAEILFQLQAEVGIRQAVRKYEEAALLYRRQNNGKGERLSLHHAGIASEALNEGPKAIGYYEQVLSLAEEANDKQGQAVALTGIGSVYDKSGEPDEAVKYYGRALEITKNSNFKSLEGTLLNNLGSVYLKVGDMQQALENYDKALPIKRAERDTGGEAIVLHNTGKAYYLLGSPQAALKNYETARALWPSVRDRSVAIPGLARTLAGIGQVYLSLGRFQESLKSYEEALKINRATGSITGTAYSLTDLGLAYIELGDRQEALKHLNEALALHQSALNPGGEAQTLTNIGGVYDSDGKKREALQYYEKALSIYQRIKEPSGIAMLLGNIGSMYWALDERQKGLELLERSLQLQRQIGERGAEAGTLTNIGVVYDELKESKKAKQYFGLALPLRRAVGDRRGEVTTLFGLMRNAVNLRQPRFAIFLGKLAINRYQELRENISSLNISIQQSFLKEREFIYSEVADLLFLEQRPAEALQLLSIAKDQEFYDLPESGRRLNVVALTQRELEAQSSIEDAYKKMTPISQKLAQFRARTGNKDLSVEAAATLQELQSEFAAESLEFKALLDRIETAFKELSVEESRLPSVEELSAIQQTLRELEKSTGVKSVAIYVLMARSRCHSLMVAPHSVVNRKSDVDVGILNEKIASLLQKLQNRQNGYLGPSQELYQWLLKPLESDLKKYKPSLLMWSLDRSLRYLPMGALYDGKKYLIERYQHAVFTRADGKRMLGDVIRPWSGVGFGSSQPQNIKHRLQEYSFPGLIGVKRELDFIFGNAQSAVAGIVSGRIYLNEEFSKQELFKTLKQRQPLVHIASHFKFQPGDDQASFLLLGNGETLSLNELKQEAGVFNGVELLNLSSCETAAQLSGAFGREIDGFAELAQRLGAKSVMASLWRVADDSTPDLMAEFYRSREAGGLTKAAALQKAQLALIGGKIKPRLKSIEKDRSAPGNKKRSESGRGSAAYSHPYYWAPFILIGNWR